MNPSHVTRHSFSDFGLTHPSQECFNLQNTNSSGALPTELGQLRVIDTFSVKYNTLTGTLPTEIGCMTTLEKNLNFEDNQLTGEIPTEIGMLTDGVAGTLANFSFAKNSFNGTIPTSISSFVTYEGQIHFEENELCANNKTAVFGQGWYVGRWWWWWGGGFDHRRRRPAPGCPSATVLVPGRAPPPTQTHIPPQVPRVGAGGRR